LRIKFLIIIYNIILLTQASATSGESVKIIAGGDVMIGSWAEDVIRSNGWNYPFVHLDTVLMGADIVFANLEAAFGQEDSSYEKTYTFQVNPELVKVLSAGKINVVSLANNHIMDFGIGALKETIKVLGEHNIKYTGAGMNLTEARIPAIMEVNQKKMALCSYSLTFPEEFWATDSTAGTCFPSHTFFYEDLKEFKATNDYVIVSFHWGGELMNTPKEYQVELAHKAIDAGADLILGHHPHVIQGIERYKDKLIFYSLGNYIFASYSDKATKSMLVKFIFGTNQLLSCKIYPINVHNRYVDFQPRLLLNNDKINFFNELNTLSLELNEQPVVVNNAGSVEL
jgi:poly-gamma-glutamate synthesis protein (capsule biosynthesis protein)